MKTKTLRKDKVNVITMGCSKNTVDSEDLITQLQHNKIDVAHNTERDANIIIINTCGFIDLAKQESIDAILQYAELKKEGEIDKLFVTGCLSHRYKDELREEIPEVDDFFGTMELPALLNKFNIDYKHELIGDRWTATPQHYAYLKISEGCNRTCAFCAIPQMRGQHVSQPIEALVDRAEGLARQGVKELILIAQELTYYGLDIYKERALPRLLDELSDVDGIEWIRLHYAYPTKFPLEIIDAMKRNKEVCNYLDMPLQHASNHVLENMHRQITVEETRELINEIKSRIPDITMRTTMMVGFPDETEEDFQQLCDFVKEMEFDRLGVFHYSHEEDTTAYEMEDNVPADVKSERAEKVMEIQQDISYRKNLEKIGEEIKVLIDRKDGEFFVGRSESDSPEVDNEILIPAEQYARRGDFVKVKITDATEYDLYGDLIREE